MFSLIFTQSGLRFKPRPNQYNISYNIIQALVWPPCFIVLYHVVSCCMKFDRDQIFSVLNKYTCYNSKRNYLVPYSKESPLALMHLWHLSTIPSFWEEYFAERLLKDVFLKCFFFSKFKILFHTFVIRQTQFIPNDSQ